MSNTRMRQRVLRAAVCVAAALASCVPAPPLGAAPRSFDVAAWDRQLQRYVDDDGRVAYRDWFSNDRDSLESIVQQFADADPSGWPEAAQLAFWINAYNLGTVWAVSQGRSAESLLGRARLFRFWRFRVAGSERTLDEIEHDILRRRFEDARIHFAIVCASTSCPVLRSEAYVARRLEAQLDDQARRFVNDPERNRIDRQTGEIRLSKIFDWFADDFRRHGTRLAFIASFVNDPETRRWLLDGAGGSDVDFLPYDWTLNAQPGQRPR